MSATWCHADNPSAAMAIASLPDQAALTHRPGYLCLDNAFILIEGHPATRRNKSKNYSELFLESGKTLLRYAISKPITIAIAKHHRKGDILFRKNLADSGGRRPFKAAFQPIMREFHGLHPNGQGKLLISFSPSANYAEVRAIEVLEEAK